MLPQFNRTAPFVYGFVVACCLLLYMVLQLLWPNASIIVYQTTCFALPCLWFCYWAGLKNAFERKNWQRKAWLVFLLSVAVSFAVNGFAEILEMYFPMPEFLVQAYEKIFHKEMAFGFAFDLLQIAVVPAIAEELLFRGLILTGLLKHFSPRVAMLVSATIFAVYHLNLWHLPFLFLLGLFFAAVYIKTNNLALAMLAHFTNNAIGVMVYYQTGHF